MSVAFDLDVEAPIVGRARVARAFGLTESALRRWLRDDEAGISAYVFRFGPVRLATTRRDVARFLDHVRATSPREEALRRVERLQRTASGRGLVKESTEGRPARPVRLPERSPA